jgi:hypothetical protein
MAATRFRCLASSSMILRSTWASVSDASNPCSFSRSFASRPGLVSEPGSSGLALVGAVGWVAAEPDDLSGLLCDWEAANDAAVVRARATTQPGRSMRDIRLIASSPYAVRAGSEP